MRYVCLLNYIAGKIVDRKGVDNLAALLTAGEDAGACSVGYGCQDRARFGTAYPRILRCSCVARCTRLA